MSASSKRVLLVEDNVDCRYLATVLLESEGFRVTIATSGEAAVARLNDETFSLVLLDLQLPDIEGFDLARLIRADPRHGDVPIIAVTAFATVEDRRRAFAAGCSGYLEKPIDTDVFVAQVRCQAGVLA